MVYERWFITSTMVERRLVSPQINNGGKEDQDTSGQRNETQNMQVDDFHEVKTNKRNHNQTLKDHDPENQQENPTQINQVTPQKKPFMSHALRHTKKKLRMDYPTATSRREAYKKWIIVMQTICRIDATTIIHS